jgi:hypothetical protein
LALDGPRNAAAFLVLLFFSAQTFAKALLHKGTLLL